MTASDSIGLAFSIVLVVAVWVGLMLLFRRIVWWYWGIDKMLGTLRSIDESLRQLPAVRTYDSQGQRLNRAA